MSGKVGALARLVVLYDLWGRGGLPKHPNVKALCHCLNQRTHLMQLYRIVALQLQLIAFFADEIGCAPSNVESHGHNVLVVANRGEEFGVCGDHGRWWW